MNDFLKIKAAKITAILDAISEVNHCAIYGSLATDTYDELSDIDINIDVSGSDNGQFILHTGKTCSESRLQTASKVFLPVALL